MPAGLAVFRGRCGLALGAVSWLARRVSQSSVVAARATRTGRHPTPSQPRCDLWGQWDICLAPAKLGRLELLLSGGTQESGFLSRAYSAPCGQRADSEGPRLWDESRPCSTFLRSSNDRAPVSTL